MMKKRELARSDDKIFLFEIVSGSGSKSYMVDYVGKYCTSGWNFDNLKDAVAQYEWLKKLVGGVE